MLRSCRSSWKPFCCTWDRPEAIQAYKIIVSGGSRVGGIRWRREDDRGRRHVEAVVGRCDGIVAGGDKSGRLLLAQRNLVEALVELLGESHGVLIKIKFSWTTLIHTLLERKNTSLVFKE